MTPSRLHFGFLNLGAGYGRKFGSVGLTLEYPNYVIEAQRGIRTQVSGFDALRAASLLDRLMRHLRIREGLKVHIKGNIPRHVGLGSGTQLSLALGTLISRAFKIHLDQRSIPLMTGRRRMSGIGTAAFERGGFIVDGGLRDEEAKPNYPIRTPHVVVRRSFPQDWIMVTIIPRAPRGLSGSQEKQAFSRLISPGPQYVGKICRLVLTRLLPSLVDKEIEDFGQALTSLQLLVGKCFATVQGGVFAGRHVQTCVKFLLKHGAYGAGQSSWGPTVYGLVEGRDEAELLMECVREKLLSSIGGIVFGTVANNDGARVFLNHRLQRAVNC